MIWILGLIDAVFLLTLLALVDVPCDHRMYAHIDNLTGRIYEACRCGRRFQVSRLRRSDR